MSHPLCWPQSLSSYSHSTFYLLGQSPAISLTQDLSPEQSAIILSLECNDIYNVLFTLQADLYVGPGPRKIDITCSASETAVLARNILAFTLIHDGAPIDQIWNIYYHFKLDAPSAELLTRQTQTLADASASHGSWNQSLYHNFIDIIDANTLSELHRYWVFYARFPTLSSSRVDKLQSEQKQWSDALLHKLGPNCNAAVARSATLVWAEAAVPISNQFRRYLRTGTTSAQVNDLALNPTWVYSSLGEKFDPAASSFPMSFHLVSAFLLPSKIEPTPYLESPLDKAKEQFESGCKAFKKSLKANAIILRFYVGDAIPFCRAFTRRGADPNQMFTSPWHAHTVDISSYFLASPPPPHRFDAIHTSRLGDTAGLGLINVLLATHPLRATSTSPIYTEVHSITEEPAVQLFIERISADVPCFSLFMGLVPRAYASGFDSQSVTTDITVFNTPEYWQRAVWIDVTTGDPHPQSQVGVSFSVDDLADALFGVYRQMHFYDNTPEFYAPATFPQMRTWSELSVTRETVALFFRHIQDRGQVWIKDGTWETVGAKFLKLVEGDSVVFDGSRHLEDMKLQLGLVGILPLQMDELVCVVLSIPTATKELDILREFDEEVPPALSCALRPGPNGKSQVFSSIHGAWGKLVPSSDSNQFTIEESPEGTSNLIISFWAPAKLVQPGTQVELVFRYTCLVLHTYQKRLGSDYVIFKATVGSDERIRILKEQPAREVTRRAPLVAPAPIFKKAGDIGFEVQGYWKEDRWYTKSITGRLDISSEEEKLALKDGGKVEMTQVGPCALKLSVGDYAHTIVFGYPIREKNVKVRIARKSAYIEMIADPYNPLGGGYPHTHFPSPVWNMHHITLDAMPSINVDNFPDHQWLVPHMSLQHSDHERAIMRSPLASTPRDKLHALKIDINTIVHHFFGFEALGGPFEVFALSVPGEGVQAIVLVAGMKIDLANGTILLDAGVIPVCPATKGQVLPLLDPIGKAGVLIMSVDIKQGEMGVMKEYLAACVERCRTWSHRPDCSKTESFLCTCGQGIGFTAPEWNLAWWTQLFPHATRAAISPIFSVAYLELVAGDEFKIGGYGSPPPSTTPLNGCWACAKSGVELSVCGKCKRARYCSPDCQKGHWKDHKKSCGK